MIPAIDLVVGYRHPEDGATYTACVVEDGPTKGLSRCRCVECGRWLLVGWSYQPRPVDGNYIECSACRYGAPAVDGEYAGTDRRAPAKGETPVTTRTFSTLGELLTLFGPAQLVARTRGSTTERGLDYLPPGRPVAEFDPEPACRFGAARYFRVHAPELHGRLGAVPVEALGVGQRIALRRRPAPQGHGEELYVDLEPTPDSMPHEEWVTIIIGPDSEPPAGRGTAHLIGWTWHPGEPLAPVPAHVCPGCVNAPGGGCASGYSPRVEKLNPKTGVKVHNGA